MSENFNIKDFAMEARKLKGLPVEETAVVAKKAPQVDWELIISDYPDIVIKKTRATKTEYLVIMPSVEGYYIKSVNNKTGAEEISQLDGDLYSKFTAKMPDIALPADYWWSVVKPGKAEYEELSVFLHNPTYCDIIRHRAFPDKFDTFGMTRNPYNSPYRKWRSAYETNKDIWLEFGHDRKIAELLSYDPDIVPVFKKMYGIENTRDYLHELSQSVMMLGRSYRDLSYQLEEMPFASDNYTRFKEYTLYEAVAMGYGLSLQGFLRIWFDTLNMQKQIYDEIVDRYPKDLASQHQILSYKTAMLRQEIEEKAFRRQCKIAKEYEAVVGDYIFKAPRKREDFHNEAVQQANCVAGYVKNFAAGDCLIFFMRRKDAPEVSYITIEVRNNRVVQSKRRFNQNPSINDMDIIHKWEDKVFNRHMQEAE